MRRRAGLPRTSTRSGRFAPDARSLRGKPAQHLRPSPREKGASNPESVNFSDPISVHFSNPIDSSLRRGFRHPTRATAVSGRAWGLLLGAPALTEAGLAPAGEGQRDAGGFPSASSGRTM